MSKPHVPGNTPRSDLGEFEMKKSIVLILLSLFVISSTVIGQDRVVAKELTLDPGVKPHNGIDQNYARFSEAYKLLDAKIVTDLYTETAFYLTPESGMDRGRELIGNNFGSFFRSVKERKGGLAISFQIVERRISGDMGYDVGIYTLASTNPSGETTRTRGKFVVIALKQKNGDWKFQLDAFSGLPKEE